MLPICQNAPEIEGRDIINDKPFKLSEHKGTPVLVAFDLISAGFDTDPIFLGILTGQYYLPTYFIKSLNYLKYPEYPSEELNYPLDVVMVAAPDSNYELDNYQSFAQSLKDIGVKIPIIIDAKAWYDYGITTAPFLVFIDSEHKINNFENVDLINANIYDDTDYKVRGLNYNYFIRSKFNKICPPPELVNKESMYIPTSFEIYTKVFPKNPVGQDSEN